MKGPRPTAKGGNPTETQANNQRHGGAFRQGENRVSKPLTGGAREAFREAAPLVLHPEAYSRAATAAAAIRAEYGAKIAAVRKDRSLTPAQRAAAVMELKRLQKEAAKAIKRRILAEERQSARASAAGLPWRSISPLEMSDVDAQAMYTSGAAAAVQSQARPSHAPAFSSG